MLQGRCFCAAVRFTTPLPVQSATICHCESCRRASGAMAVAWYTVPVSQLRIDAGELSERESSPGAFRGYCADCHSPLTYRSASRPDEIDVVVAALEDPAQVVPTDHIFVDDTVAWARPNDGRPIHGGSRAASEA